MDHGVRHAEIIDLESNPQEPIVIDDSSSVDAEVPSAEPSSRFAKKRRLDSPTPSFIDWSPEANKSARDQPALGVESPVHGGGEDVESHEFSDLVDNSQALGVQEHDETAVGWMARVLDVFPDISLEHLRKLRSDLVAETARDTASELIMKVLDDGAYPKEKDNHKERKRKLDIGSGDKEVWTDLTGQKKVIMCTITLLQDEFTDIPVPYIRQVVSRKLSLTAAFLELVEAQRTYDENDLKPYRKIKTERIPKQFSERRHNLQFSGYTSATAPELCIAMDNLNKELKAARKLAQEENAKRQADATKIAAEEENEQEYRRTGNMIECDESFHLFCFDCARRNADNEIGQSKYKVRCMDGSGCQASFSRDQMDQFLDPKTIAMLSRLQQQDELRLAGLEDLVKCPFCDYAAIYPPVEVDWEFRCEGPDCQRDKGVNVRHTVEEAMSDALIRKCPKCEAKFVKELGCNKMMCPTCKTLQCYVCSKVIRDYSHFDDETRNGARGRCPLFDNTDLRHDADVKKAEEAAMAKAKEENPGLSEEELKIQMAASVQPVVKHAPQQAAPRYLADPLYGGNPIPLPYPPRPYHQYADQLGARVEDDQRRLGPQHNDPYPMYWRAGLYRQEHQREPVQPLEAHGQRGLHHFQHQAAYRLFGLHEVGPRAFAQDQQGGNPHWAGGANADQRPLLLNRPQQPAMMDLAGDVPQGAPPNASGQGALERARQWVMHQQAALFGPWE
ncbi:MAG: hypothetical protein M1833_001235 [Piccolia ochrophora]|nr:MAG: hypothetical protein M1833_001235 [Piccolia ochrophora]